MKRKDDNKEEKLQLTTQKKIIEFIITVISPGKIFLINHVANGGEKEFFDFIIIVPDASQTASLITNKSSQYAALIMLTFT